MSLNDIEAALVQLTKDGNMNPFMFRGWASNMERSIARHSRRGGKAGRQPGSRNDSRKGPRKGREKGKPKASKASDKSSTPASRPESSKDGYKKTGLVKLLKSLSINVPKKFEDASSRWKEDYIPFLTSEDGEAFYKRVQHMLHAPVDGSDDIPEDKRKAFIRRENIKAMLEKSNMEESEVNNSRAYFPAYAEGSKHKKTSSA